MSEDETIAQPSATRTIRLYLTLLFSHTLPAPYFLFVVAFFLPPALPIFGGLLLATDGDWGDALLYFALGLVGVGITWGISLVVTRLLFRDDLVSFRLLLMVTAFAITWPFMPIYLIAGHTSSEWTSLLPLLQNSFEENALLLATYLIAIVVSLVVLLVRIRSIEEGPLE